jgi:hypothetical protein
VAGPKGQRVEHPVPAPPRAARRHCWVTGSDDAPGPHAGIVLGWERRGERWYAQVAYVIEDDDALVVQWLCGDLLRPAAP